MACADWIRLGFQIGVTIGIIASIVAAITASVMMIAGSPHDMIARAIISVLVFQIVGFIVGPLVGCLSYLVWNRASYGQYLYGRFQPDPMAVNPTNDEL